MNEVYIVAAKRTPIGSFLGGLSHLSAPQLGASAIREVYSVTGVDPNLVNSVYMGNVLSAGLGQSPARQAGLLAGLAHHTDSTTVNKVCAAGMKATMLGAQQIQLGLDHLVITGGMESMSNVPHYAHYRKPTKLGDVIFTDGLLKDGLTDVYHQFNMGRIAEMSVQKYQLTREAQDAYTIDSYKKAADATQQGKFNNEIIPIRVESKKGANLISQDEDVDKIVVEKLPNLPPAFMENGTITAANASNLNDGAAALMLASSQALQKYNLQPLARIISYADAAQAPEDYATTPSVAIPIALKRAGLTLADIDFIEINEAFAAVILANQKILNFNLHLTNVYGGAVALGHPLGASGARILCTLLSVLQQEGGRYGLAAICNGGGGASAMVIENLNR
jgi:acetyl-CoA C-acetyltransferase